MSLSSEQIEAVLDVVHEADQAIMEVYGSGQFDTHTKEDDSPVTRADLLSNDILTAGLRRIFPNIAIVSEEGDAEANSEAVRQPEFWLVDPLDGTKEFVAQTGRFTVCVALIQHDLPSFGIVSVPATGTTYYGGPAYGSFKRTATTTIPIHVAASRTGVVFGSESSPTGATTDFIRHYFPSHTLTNVQGPLKLPYIAEGKADAYPKIHGPQKVWDIAAGHAVLAGAGGSVQRPDGCPIDYHATNLMAGDFLASRHPAQPSPPLVQP